MKQLVDLVECRGKVYLHRVHNGRRECLAQHTFVSVGAMQAWLSGVHGEPVGKLGVDGVSGRYAIEFKDVKMAGSDEVAHVEDSLRSGEFK